MTERFDELTKEEQLKIEEDLVSLITTKNTTILLIGGNIGWLVKLPRIESSIASLRIADNVMSPIKEYYPIRCYHRSKPYVKTFFKFLPNRVILLLAITHRPLFELYKKYLSNNHLEFK